MSNHQDQMKAIKKEAEAMLRHPQLLFQIAADIGLLGVAGEHTLCVTIYLIGTSRLLAEPLSARVHGEPSSGKSYTIDKVGDLFPPEDVIRATHITPQALYYMPEGGLRHKFVVAGERSRMTGPEAVEATRAWRELTEGGKLDKLVARKGKEGFETDHIHQEGPIAFVESTTLSRSDIIDEDTSRCLYLSTDESSEQTGAVYMRMAEGKSEGRELSWVIEVHHEAQRILRGRLNVVSVPFAKWLAVRFPRDKVQGRRALRQVIAAIKACALLHQFQRQTIGNGGKEVIVAEPYDYRIAADFLGGHVAAMLYGTNSKAAAKFYDEVLLANWPIGGTFSTTDAREKEELDKRNVQRYLRDLWRAGWVERLREAQGPIPALYKLRKPLTPGQIGLAMLPNPYELAKEMQKRKGGDPAA